MSSTRARVLNAEELRCGVPLVIAQLTARPAIAPEALRSVIPGIALAYGLASLGAFMGECGNRHWALPVILASEGTAAVGLLGAYATGARDWSVLLVAAIADGAALSAALGRFRRC